MLKFFQSYRFRSVLRIVLWLLLIVTCISSTMNALKPVPQYPGIDSLTRYSWRMATVAQSFVKQYLTYTPEDETYANRIYPFIGDTVNGNDLINLKDLTKSQSAVDTWVTSSMALPNNNYIVKVGVTVRTTDLETEETIERTLLVGVPLEMTGDGAFYVNGSPSIMPYVVTQSTQGLDLGIPLSTSDPEMSRTISNFMIKLSNDTDGKDLANFVDSEFEVIPMGGFASFVKINSVKVYYDSNYAGVEDGKIHYVVVANITMKDNLTNQTFSPDYMFRMYEKDGKYYIAWMTHQPYVR